MFAEYNYDSFPLIYVKLNNVVDDEDFDNFLEEWLNLYIKKNNFIFIFDTTNVCYVPIKYSIRMADFIKNLKNNNSYHYLQKNIIIVNSYFVKNMLNLIFKLQSPVAPVYIIENKDRDKINSLLNNQNIEDVICIIPGKSLIPFL